MLVSLVVISAFAGGAAVLVACFSRRIGSGREIVVTLAAPCISAALFITVARVYVRQPFSRVGPEFGALVAGVAVALFIANFAVSLLLVPWLMRRWPSARHEAR